MPRNSLVNGKTAPDSFGTQLDEVAYPILMADQLRLNDATLYANHIKPAANYLVAHGPALGVRALGGTERLLAIHNRRRDRRARCRGRPRQGERRSNVGGRLARHRRRLAALDQGLDGDDERAAVRESVLHPAVQDRGPERGHLLQRRQRRSDPRPTRGHRCRLPRTRSARRAAGGRPGRGPVPADRRRHASIDDTAAGPAGIATTATGTATAAATERRGRPPAQGTGHVWPVLSAERAEQAARIGRRGHGGPAARGHGAFASGVGLIPEQDWELPALPASAVRHRSDARLDRLHQRHMLRARHRR